jgi:predicted Rossmann-fold nucleotide-binding protein
MFKSVLGRSLFKKSFNDLVKYTKPRDPIKVGEMTREYNIVLVGNDEGINQRLLGPNALRAKLSNGFTVSNVQDSQLYNPEKSAFLNFEAISRNITKPNDAFVFGYFNQKTATREQKIMLYGAVMEAIISKSISPAHKNKSIILLNENGCYDEVLSILTKMYNMGALGDSPSRLLTVIDKPRHGDVTAEIMRHSHDYFKVDAYDLSKPTEEIETYGGLGLGEHEYSVTGLCSASLRGTYYNREKQFARSLADEHITGVWGLGDKIGCMGGFYHGYMEHAEHHNLNRPLLAGSSTKDIAAAETYSGRGVVGVDGIIFEGLAPRTFHVLQGDGLSTTSGGAGTAYEVLAFFLDQANANKPKVFRTIDRNDPIIDLATAVTGITPDRPNDSNVHFVFGHSKEGLKEAVNIFTKDRAHKYPEKWGVGNEVLIS